jgi:hypothetical protein
VGPCIGKVLQEADEKPDRGEQLLVCLEVRIVFGAIQHAPTALLHEHFLERQGRTSDVLGEGDTCFEGGRGNLHGQIYAEA